MAHETGKITWDAKLVGEDVKRFLREGTKLLKRMNEEWKKMGTEVRRTGDAHRRVEKDTTGPLAKMRNQVLGIATAWRTVHEALALARAEYGFMIEKQERAGRTAITIEQAKSLSGPMLKKALGLGMPEVEEFVAEKITPPPTAGGAGLPATKFWPGVPRAASAAAVGLEKGQILESWELGAQLEARTGEQWATWAGAFQHLMRATGIKDVKTAAGLWFRTLAASALETYEAGFKRIPQAYTTVGLFGFGTPEEQIKTTYSLLAATTAGVTDPSGEKTITMLNAIFRATSERAILPRYRDVTKYREETIAGATVRVPYTEREKYYAPLPRYITPEGEAPGWGQGLVQGISRAGSAGLLGRGPLHLGYKALEAAPWLPPGLEAMRLGGRWLKERGLFGVPQRELLPNLNVFRPWEGVRKFMGRELQTWGMEDYEYFGKKFAVGARSVTRRFMQMLYARHPKAERLYEAAGEEWEAGGGVAGLAGFMEERMGEMGTRYTVPRSAGKATGVRLQQTPRGKLRADIATVRDILREMWENTGKTGALEATWEGFWANVKFIGAETPEDVYRIGAKAAEAILKETRTPDIRVSRDRILGLETKHMEGYRIGPESQIILDQMNMLRERAGMEPAGGTDYWGAPTTQPAVPTTQPAETKRAEREAMKFLAKWERPSVSRRHKARKYLDEWDTIYESYEEWGMTPPQDFMALREPVRRIAYPFPGDEAPTTQPAETEAVPAGGVSSAINRLTDFLDAMQLNTMNGPQGYPAARTPMATVFA